MVNGRPRTQTIVWAVLLWCPSTHSCLVLALRSTRMVKLHWQGLNPRSFLMRMKLIHLKMNPLYEEQTYPLPNFEVQVTPKYIRSTWQFNTEENPFIYRPIAYKKDFFSVDSSESLRFIMQYSPREEGAGMRCQIMSTWSWSESSLSWQQPGVKTDQRLWGEWGQGDLKWHIRGVWHRG